MTDNNYQQAEFEQVFAKTNFGDEISTYFVRKEYSSVSFDHIYKLFREFIPVLQEKNGNVVHLKSLPDIDNVLEFGKFILFCVTKMVDSQCFSYIVDEDNSNQKIGIRITSKGYYVGCNCIEIEETKLRKEIELDEIYCKIVSTQEKA